MELMGRSIIYEAAWVNECLYVHTYSIRLYNNMYVMYNTCKSIHV